MEVFHPLLSWNENGFLTFSHCKVKRKSFICLVVLSKQGFPVKLSDISSSELISFMSTLPQKTITNLSFSWLCCAEKCNCCLDCLETFFQSERCSTFIRPGHNSSHMNAKDRQDYVSPKCEAQAHSCLWLILGNNTNSVRVVLLYCSVSFCIKLECSLMCADSVSTQA